MYRARSALDAPVHLPPWDPSTASIHAADELGALRSIVGAVAVAPPARAVASTTSADDDDAGTAAGAADGIAQEDDAAAPLPADTATTDVDADGVETA